MIYLDPEITPAAASVILTASDMCAPGACARLRACLCTVAFFLFLDTKKEQSAAAGLQFESPEQLAAGCWTLPDVPVS